MAFSPVVLNGAVYFSILAVSRHIQGLPSI